MVSTPRENSASIEMITQDSACSSSEQNAVAENIVNETPLHRKWAIYLISNSKANKSETDWQNNQELVCRFNTVEQFWRVQNNISTPRELDNVDLCLCHDDLMLAWEHPRFERGGKWTVRMPEMSKLDTVWLYLTLSSIGEQLPGCCGVSVSIRKAYSKVTLWLDNDVCSSLGNVQSVGRKAAHILKPLCTDAFSKFSLQYSFFHDTLPDISAEINQKWTFNIDGGVISDCKVENDPPVLPSKGGKFGRGAAGNNNNRQQQRGGKGGDGSRRDNERGGRGGDVSRGGDVTPRSPTYAKDEEEFKEEEEEEKESSSSSEEEQ